MKRILPLLLLLVFATTASGEGVYFNRARGFLFPGFPPEVPFILRADTAGQAAPSLPLNLGDDDFTLSLIFDNLRDTPDRDYRYSDADGKRRKAIMPGFTLILEDAGGQRFTTNWGYKVTELPVGDTRAAETRLTVTAPGMNPSSFNIGKNKKRNRLALCRRGDNMRIEAGSDKTADGLTVPLPVGFAPVHLSIVPDGGAEFAFFNLALTCDTPEEPPQMPVPEISQRIILSSDSRAGYWAQAGFTVDNNFIVNGGDYVVAIVPLPGGFRARCAAWHYRPRRILETRYGKMSPDAARRRRLFRPLAMPRRPRRRPAGHRHFPGRQPGHHLPFAPRRHHNSASAPRLHPGSRS